MEGGEAEEAEAEVGVVAVVEEDGAAKGKEGVGEEVVVVGEEADREGVVARVRRGRRSKARLLYKDIGCRTEPISTRGVRDREVDCV